MRFIPIPTPVKGQPIEETEVWKTRNAWGPFIPRIADRSDETVDELIALVFNGQVQVGVVFDDNDKPRALIGMIFRQLGRELIGELRWATGFGVKDNWEYILSEAERYLKEKVGCTISKPFCRPGWKPLLKKHGYKQTHVVMEKML